MVTKYLKHLVFGNNDKLYVIFSLNIKTMAMIFKYPFSGALYIV